MTISNSHIKHLFSAPLLRFPWKDCKDLNESLKKLILEKQELFPSERMSNTGGWQSPKTLHTWEAPCIRQLINNINIAVLHLITECLGEENTNSLGTWNIAAWANINEEGDYNMIHNHSGGVWSGVYYVDAGTPDPAHPFSGILTFHSPTLASLTLDNLRAPQQLRHLFRSEYSMIPKNGLMLLFPSWLAHSVHPYFGSTPRISISWDVMF